MARFKSPCKPPEGLRRELLTILAEECDEVGIRVSKALRFGLEEIQPGQEFSNQERIALEVGDIYEVINRLTSLGLIDHRFVLKGMEHKSKQLDDFLQNDA